MILPEGLGDKDLIDADRISVDIIEKALKQLKTGKNDAVVDMQSDCLINGPPSLKLHLSNLLKTFVIHGTVPNFILICKTLIFSIQLCQCSGVKYQILT